MEVTYNNAENDANQESSLEQPQHAAQDGLVADILRRRNPVAPNVEFGERDQRLAQRKEAEEQQDLRERGVRSRET